MDNFFITSKYLNIINISKKALSQKYSLKDLREVEMIIG